MPPRRCDLQRQDGRQRLALEAQRRVGRILDDGDVELGGQIEQPLARGKRQRLARRVGEARHHVGELDARRPPRAAACA